MRLKAFLAAVCLALMSGAAAAQVPTGTNNRESRARAARTAMGVRTLRCSGKLTS